MQMVPNRGKRLIYFVSTLDIHRKIQLITSPQKVTNIFAPASKKIFTSTLKQNFQWNFFYLQLAGLAAVGVGIWMLFDPGRFDEFLGKYTFVIPASILIAAGLFVVFVGFCGCVGAIKENKCLLGTVSNIFS